MNQNGNHNHHQSHGGMSTQEHGWNQNWNPHTNFNVQGGFAQPPRAIGTPNFVRYAPPPPILRFDAPYMPVHQYPMVFSGELTHIENMDFFSFTSTSFF